MVSIHFFQFSCVEVGGGVGFGFVGDAAIVAVGEDFDHDVAIVAEVFHDLFYAEVVIAEDGFWGCIFLNGLVAVGVEFEGYFTGWFHDMDMFRRHE